MKTKAEIRKQIAELQRELAILEAVPVPPDPKARLQFLFDVFVTALEGGIGYWSFCDKYHWTNDKGETEDLQGFFATIIDLEAEDGAFEKSTINAEVIEKGIKKILEDPEFQICKDIKESIREGSSGNDGGYIDADGADCIIQAGLFGEIVFG